MGFVLPFYPPGEATKVRKMLWKWRPQARRTCWMEESFLGTLKRCAGPCHRATIELRALQRYLL
eukprot:4682973-Prorocentrum_lima.AAC.1